MKKETIEKLLPYIGTTVAYYRAGWAIASCPLAHWRHDNGKDVHPSFGIKVNPKGESYCKCFSCNFGGDLTDLHIALATEAKGQSERGIKLGQALQLIANELEEVEFDLDIPDYKKNSKKNTAVIPYPDWWLDSFPKAQEFSEAMQYLVNRGIPPENVKALDIRWDPILRRVGFPFRDFKGRLMGVQGRAVDINNNPKYYFYSYGDHINANVWLGEHSLNLDIPVILVEGPFDYAAVYRIYKNVAASFSAGISKAKVQRIGEAREVITFYDYGKGGNAARKCLRQVLKETPMVDIVPPNADMDPGAMPDSMLIEYLKEHVLLSM